MENKSKTTYYKSILINQILGVIFIGIGVYTKVPIWYVPAVGFIGFGLIRNFFFMRMLKR